jgi:predicted amidohydrolase
MKVATCQMPETRNDLVAAMSLVNEFGAAAASNGARLVCFPECFLQGYELAPEQVADSAIDLSSKKFREVLNEFSSLEPVIVVGLIEREAHAFYNSAVVIERGHLIARYRKMHLLQGERLTFKPGVEPAIFQVDELKIGINICYDLNFSESIERNAITGAKLLVCPCSNMMPRAKADEWKLRHNEIRSRQAKEHGLWIVCSDIVGERDGRISYGPTAVIDPSGTVVDQVPLLDTGMVIAEIS